MDGGSVIAGLRITPSVVQFNDTVVNKSYRQSLTLQNVSGTSKSLRIRGPATELFKFKSDVHQRVIAPGLVIKATVEYLSPTQEHHKDRILLISDDDIIEVPLLGLCPVPLLRLEGSIDFGTVPTDGRVLKQKVKIINDGSKAGQFEIRYPGLRPIKILPNSGTVEPHEQLEIEVEYIADSAIEFEEHAVVILDNQPETKLTIKAKVVKRRLELLNPSNNGPLRCVNFGPTYYGTSKKKQALLYNNSPDAVEFIAIMLEDQQGQEMNVDLSLTTAQTLATNENDTGYVNDLLSLITTNPNQGILQPYEKKLIQFRFNPKYKYSDYGFKSNVKPPQRRDYAVYMQFTFVQNSSLAEEDEIKFNRSSNTGIEVALTGSALPVLLSVEPDVLFNFGSCQVGDRTDALCTITNDSKELPVNYKFDKVAHFSVSPIEGKLQPMQAQGVIISCRPQQFGKYKKKLKLNVINSSKMTIYTVPIQLELDCIVSSAGSKIKKIGNNVSPKDLQSAISEQSPAEDKTKADTYIAQPNDLATSIRPADPHLHIKSKYTRTNRYTYTDPDYALSEEEAKLKNWNNAKYKDYIDQLRNMRIKGRTESIYNKVNNTVDIGIKPAVGLTPPTLDQIELYKDIKGQFLTEPDIQSKKMTLSNKIVDYCDNMTKNDAALKLGLKASPETPQEIEECFMTLMPAQLHLIKLAPATLDYGDVCVQSANTKHLRVANNLNTNIMFSLELEDCPEMTQSFPASQVIPPMSVGQFDCVFEASELGSYHKNITYCVNGKHKKYLVVLANVVNVDLELSTNAVILKSKVGQPAHAGFREVVYVTNSRNYPAQFKWLLSNRGNGDPTYYINPSKGFVEPFSTLTCEVICQPCFRSSSEVEFSLKVKGGNESNLRCVTEFGQAQCAFVERRLLFGSVPLHLNTTKTVLLQNTGQHHAHFEIIEPNPFFGMDITPTSGQVAVGGYTEIKVSFTPTTVQKFDTSIHVKIRSWKTISLRMGGRVEEPRVDIDKQKFYFGGIHCGSFGEETFKLINKTTTPVKVAIDLSKFQDFTLKCGQKGNEDKVVKESPNENKYVVQMVGSEVIDCILQFYPTEVASYDFCLPVTINDVVPPSPPLSPTPPTPTTSKYSYPRFDTPTTMTQLATPKRHILATALRSLLRLSHTRLDFVLPADYFDSDTVTEPLQGCVIANCSDEDLEWYLDIASITDRQVKAFQFLDKDGNALQRGNLSPGENVFLGVVFNPPQAGKYSASLPFRVSGKLQPLQKLSLFGELKAPTISFEPEEIWLPPASLQTVVTVSCFIVASGYRNGTRIEYQVAESESEDGSLARVIEVEFPKGQQVPPYTEDENQNESFFMPINIKFCTAKPISVIVPIKFVDGLGNVYFLNVAAVGENCLATAYPFLANRTKDLQIICNRHDCELPPGDPVLVKCETSSDIAISVDNTSSIFDNISSALECDEGVESESSLGYQHTMENDYDNNNDLDNRDRYKIEDIRYGYLEKAVKAIERWYSFHGWASGLSPTVVPKSFYISVARSSSVTRAGRLETNNNGKRESKTIFDLIHHLCGRHVPGIPINSPLPTNLSEKAIHLHWQYSTLLTFLKTQGGMVGSVRAEHLLEPQCYESWAKQTGGKDCYPEEFRTISIRSWAHVLLQIYKVFVLYRITQRRYRRMTSIDGSKRLDEINPDPLASNIYSMSERIVLDWLNGHYETQRYKIWPTQTPPSRWIVNFSGDMMDSLVLACVLAAHTPFLIDTHIKMLYTNPNNIQQCLHNAIHIVNAIHSLGLEYDIQANDIINPNPVSMLMLCVFLFDRLPQYTPRNNIDFQGSLHAAVVRQIRLQNPSSKPLTYSISIVGKDAKDFVVHSHHVQISPHKKIDLEVTFKSRFLRPAQASLVLVGRRSGSSQGSTLVFNMKAMVDTIKPTTTITTESPCYEVKTISITITNPFGKGAMFRLMLIESNSQTSYNSQIRSEGISSTAEVNNRDQLNAFLSPDKHVYLNANESTTIEVQFLPFHLGLHTCSVLLVNNTVGEFLYLLRAMATLPLPSVIPFICAPESVRISSAAAAGRGQGLFGGDPTIIYWRCNANERLHEVIQLPVINKVREQSLAFTAKQQMSENEVKRRELTKTLESCTVLASVAAMKLNNAPSGYRELPENQYQVKINSKHFSAPVTIPIPSSNDHDGEGNLKLEIDFEPAGAGHYPCQIVLLSKHDIRVLKVECTVTATAAAAELEFHGPAYQSIRQEIPIANYTTEDWYLDAELSGEGFFGPATIVAKSFMTTYYPIVFMPTHEYMTTGELILSNKKDGNTHVFNIKGVGDKPLALDEFTLKCQTRKRLTHVIRVPNVSRKWVTFKVVTDISCITGPGKVVVGPGKDVDYEFSVTPLRRGLHKGIISFVAKTMASSSTFSSIAQEDLHHDDSEEENDNHELLPFHDDSKLSYWPARLNGESANMLMDMPPGTHKVWFAIEINADPPPPERIFDVSCAVQSSCAIEIGISNPAEEAVTFDVTILNSTCLKAADQLHLNAKESTNFRLIYSPTIIGSFNASLIFQHETLGEFWYDLSLHALPPEPTDLPLMKCELARSCKQMVQLKNPTDEILHLVPHCSNPNNFRMDIALNEEFTLDAQSSVDIPLEFTPSILGICNQTAIINFKSPEIGDWKFNVKGCGLVPSKVDPVYVSSLLGASASLILPFHNPFDETLRVIVELIEKSDEYNPAVQQPVFKLLLKHTHNILLQPKGTLEIPFSFAPETMNFFETICCINVRRLDDNAFVDDEGNAFDHLQWHIPIFGIPELVTVDSQGTIVHCQARSRLEERLEITMVNSTESTLVEKSSLFTRAVTPSPLDSSLKDDETLLNEDFEYRLVYSDESSKNLIEQAVGLSLIRKIINPSTNIIRLVFHLIFAPFKPFNASVQLVVTAKKRGVWKFPVRFRASPPQVDDTICIESVGLNKQSVVSFRLFSQEKFPIPFEAFFEHRSDSAFQISPKYGELLPLGTSGTSFTITYTPTTYGRTHRARLIVQTKSMQWTYAVKGLPRDYVPPTGRSTVDTSPQLFAYKKRNFVQENLRISATGVSSPVKGARLLKTT